jgi:hypothetical protein
MKASTGPAINPAVEANPLPAGGKPSRGGDVSPVSVMSCFLKPRIFCPEA